MLQENTTRKNLNRIVTIFLGAFVLHKSNFNTQKWKQDVKTAFYVALNGNMPDTSQVTLLVNG